MKLPLPPVGVTWLPPFIRSIVQGLREPWDSPLRLQELPTASLPAAADWRGGLVFDGTTTSPKYSNGTAWGQVGFPRATTATSSATPSINADTTDVFGLTAQAVNITSFTTNLTGTPQDGQKLWVYIVGTAARTIAWGASFEASTAALPVTTVSTNRLDVGFIWNAATSKWRCVGSV